MRFQAMFMVLATAAACGAPQVGQGGEASAPPCAQDQCVYQDCISHSCQLKPDVKQIKKTVYEVQEVPFCLKKLPPLCSLFHHHGCDCEQCAECQCPRYKKVLVKKEIVCKEICTSKCVVEEQRVSCQPCQSCCK